MFNEDHDLLKEFPEYREQIHELKMRDPHFAKLFAAYHEVDKNLLRIEQEIEHASDPVVEDLKKQRLHYKDELFALLKKAA